MKITLNDGTELIKGKFYLWSGSNNISHFDSTWRNVLCKITDITDTEITIFEVFANDEYTWSIDSVNKKCTFKKLWFGRVLDWFKKLIK